MEAVLHGWGRFRISGDNHLLKALVPRGVWGMLPQKTFNFRATEMRFPVFSGQFEVV